MFSELLTSMLLIGIVGGPVGIGLAALLIRLFSPKPEIGLPTHEPSERLYF